MHTSSNFSTHFISTLSVSVYFISTYCISTQPVSVHIISAHSVHSSGLRPAVISYYNPENRNMQTKNTYLQMKA